MNDEFINRLGTAEETIKSSRKYKQKLENINAKTKMNENYRLSKNGGIIIKGINMYPLHNLNVQATESN